MEGGLYQILVSVLHAGSIDLADREVGGGGQGSPSSVTLIQPLTPVGPPVLIILVAAQPSAFIH